MRWALLGAAVNNFRLSLQFVTSGFMNADRSSGAPVPSPLRNEQSAAATSISPSCLNLKNVQITSIFILLKYLTDA